MANKTWTATDIAMKSIRINVIDGVLYLDRQYTFIDGNGAELTQISGGHVVAEILWQNVPANIKTALSEIDAWTKSTALANEGMA